MVKYILNGWSWTMPISEKGLLSFRHLDENEFQIQKQDAVSYVSHPAMANLLDVPCRTGRIQLNKGDTVLAVYTQGGKLAHEARTLPEGLSFGYTCIKILEDI